MAAGCPRGSAQLLLPGPPGLRGEMGLRAARPGLSTLLLSACLSLLRGPRWVQPGADAPRARWAYSLPQVDAGTREGRVPSPLCFSRTGGSYRLLDRDWSLGLGRARSLGMQRIPRSPPGLCLSPVISVLGSLLANSQAERAPGRPKSLTLEKGRGSASVTWDWQPSLPCAESGIFPQSRIRFGGGWG